MKPLLITETTIENPATSVIHKEVIHRHIRHRWWRVTWIFT